MPNPFHTYILDVWLIFLNEPVLIFFTVKWFHLFLSNMNAQLDDQIVLLQTIQFIISTQFLVYTVIYLNNFCLHALKYKSSSISNNSA